MSSRPNAFVFAYLAFSSGIRTSSFPFESGGWVPKCEGHVNWSRESCDFSRGQSLYASQGMLSRKILHLKMG